MGDTRIADRPLSVARPTQVRFAVLAAACTVAVIIYVHRVGFARALPALQDSLHLTDPQLSWLTAVFLLAYGGFEIPFGLLGDKLGTRHLLTLLVLGWSLATGLVSLVVLLPAAGGLPLAFLLTVRFLFGLFQAGAFPSLSRVLTDWAPVRARASAQGLIWTCTRLGGMFSPLLVGWLIVRCGGWRVPLWIIAGLGAVWCAAFWPWFRNRPGDMAAVNDAERELIDAGRPPGPSGHAGIPWRAMLRSRSVWALCLLYGCGGFAANFYVTLLPTYLSKQRGLPDETTSWLSGLPFVFGLVACFLGGLISDTIIRRTGNRKWGRRLTGTVGTLVGGAAWLFVGVVPDAVTLGVLLCLIFFCNDLAMAPAWASCADVGERYAGTLGGAMNMVGNLTGAAGNLIAGYLFGQELALPGGVLLPGNAVLFVIYACAFWLAALCWQGVDVTKPLPYGGPPPGREAPSVPEIADEGVRLPRPGERGA
ncbi:MAG TPA: MFS transporter [Gemmataceae bacterium]|nr:MFS transporter [Gemmataceae bacterium]